MNLNTPEKIRQLLTQALTPTYLDIQDDAHLHRGHRPANAPGGHYTVHIASPLFENKSLRDSHQLVYQALQSLMPNDIHALGIKVRNNNPH